MMPRGRPGRMLASVGISWFVVTVAAGCGGNADSSPLGSSPAPTTGTTPSDTVQSNSSAPSASPAHPVGVSVFFVDEHGNLVAREAQVDAEADRIEQALAIAGTARRDAGLFNAYSADAFASASLDGYGSHGEVGVVLSDRSVEDPQAGLTAAEARMAIRAAVCTAQVGSNYPVMFYLRTKPATTLFGQPLKDGMVKDANCPPRTSEPASTTPSD